jgi:hypothetical protein
MRRWATRVVALLTLIVAVGFVTTSLRHAVAPKLAAAKPKPAHTARASASPKPSATKHSALPSPKPSATQTPFAGTIAPINAQLRATMIASGSWKPGDPVKIEALRLLGVSFWGFDGRGHSGQIVVNADVADAALQVFRSLYAARYPIEHMKLVDAYGADETAIMRANDTSGYNGRWVYGAQGVWSQHAFGHAIDINPLQNPYTWDHHVAPPEGKVYLDRSLHALGMIHSGDAAVRAFQAVGWIWGGTWSSSKDYMHFSPSGK